MKEYFLFYGYTNYLDKENPFTFIDLDETNTEQSLLDLCDGYKKFNEENLKWVIEEDMTKTEYICKHDLPKKAYDFENIFLQCSIKD